MKKILLLLMSLITINLLFLTNNMQAATLNYTKHYYNKDNNVQYYSIAEKKYTSVNHKMKVDAGKIYKRDIQNKKIQKIDKSTYAYYDKLEPVIKYQSNSRISILTKEYWYCGGESDTLYHSYNLINGKQVTLKEAFKSKNAYDKANKQIATYLRKKIENGTWITKDGTVEFSHKKVIEEVDAFYWTKKGLYVAFDTGSIAVVAAGDQVVHVSNKYVKYYY